jgi:hypothetical protein
MSLALDVIGIDNLVDFDPRGQIMKSRLLVYAIVVGLNLQCSYSGNKARDMSGNKSDSETRTAQSEDNLELKRRHEVMESEIQSASKKLAIEALKEIHGTDEIRVWVGFGITQPRLFVMRLLNGREASFHTARTSRQGSTTVLDVPEKTILGPPKSGWAEFENFLRAQGIESAMRLSPESSSYLRSPDVQIIAIETNLRDSYNLVFYHVDNLSDDAQRALSICRRIERDFEINMYCGTPSENRNG